MAKGKESSDARVASESRSNALRSITAGNGNATETQQIAVTVDFG